MKRLVVVLNTYRPSLISFAKSPTSHLQENDFIEICRATHNYSFDIFAHRVTKCERKLSDIRIYIEQDRMHFTPQYRSPLVAFLEDVDVIITSVAKAQTTNQLPTIYIKMLLRM